jgi:hypothetical protein
MVDRWLRTSSSFTARERNLKDITVRLPGTR